MCKRLIRTEEALVRLKKRRSRSSSNSIGIRPFDVNKHRKLRERSDFINRKILGISEVLSDRLYKVFSHLPCVASAVLSICLSHIDKRKLLRPLYIHQSDIELHYFHKQEVFLFLLFVILESVFDTAPSAGSVQL